MHKYSFIIDSKANRERFQKNLELIKKLYPDYTEKDITASPDGSETAVLQCGKSTILLENNTSSNWIRVSSDRDLNKLLTCGELCTETGAQPQLQTKSLPKRILIKWIIVPIVIFLLPVLCLTADLGILLYPFLIMLNVVFYYVYDVAVYFGWILYLPAVPLALFSAHIKKPWISKAVTMSLPVLSTAFFLSEFIFSTNKTFEEIGWFSEIIYQILCYPQYIPLLLLALYLFILPVLIIDEIVMNRRETVFGTKRLGVGASAAGWGISAAAMVAITVISFFVVNYANTNSIAFYTENEQHDYIAYAENSVTRARFEHIKENYGEDILTVAEYAYEYNYYNWYECPDKSVEAEWEKLFLSEYAEYQLYSGGNGTIDICADGIYIHVDSIDRELSCTDYLDYIDSESFPDFSEC